MRFIALGLIGLLLVVLAAMTWQHVRTLRWRRDVIHDRQPLLYGAETFHVLTFVRLAPGADLVEGLRKTRNALEGTGGALFVYAGKTAFIGRLSTQLDERRFDGAVLVQYPSREAFDEVSASPSYAAAWSDFADTYSHGMKRPAGTNLAIPMGLLGLRVAQWVRRAPEVDPFDRADPALLAERGMDVEERFEKVQEAMAFSEDAVLVLNLILPGSKEQQEADRAYGLAMMSLMARGGHGPAHLGRGITLEGDARFPDVVLVYYPGLHYFTSLVQSRFFQGIVGGKQLGDTLSIPTVPILDRL